MTELITPTPQLREAEWTDIAALATLDAELFADDAWSETTWWAEFAARPRRAYTVLTAAHTILGYAGLDLGGEVADVMTIAVSPHCRGQGHGRTLLDHLVRTAREAGAEHLMLEVRADNEPAIGLYRRAGFVHISTRRRYYQPGDIDALILRKDLP